MTDLDELWHNLVVRARSSSDVLRSVRPARALSANASTTAPSGTTTPGIFSPTDTGGNATTASSATGTIAANANGKAITTTTATSSAAASPTSIPSPPATPEKDRTAFPGSVQSLHNSTSTAPAPPAKDDETVRRLKSTSVSSDSNSTSTTSAFPSLSKPHRNSATVSASSFLPILPKSLSALSLPLTSNKRGSDPSAGSRGAIPSSDAPNYYQQQGAANRRDMQTSASHAELTTYTDFASVPSSPSSSFFTSSSATSSRRGSRLNTMSGGSNLNNPLQIVSVPILDSSTKQSIQRVTKGISEILYSIANEPSLGLYRVQENSIRTIPMLVEKRRELVDSQRQIKGVSADLRFSANCISELNQLQTFHSIRELLARALEAAVTVELEKRTLPKTK